jgi:hypothetical protein
MYITGIQSGYPMMSRDPRKEGRGQGEKQRQRSTEDKDEVEISEAALKLLKQIAREELQGRI